jgi:Ca2+/Na+ antiporter
MKIQRQHRRKFFWLFAAAAVCALLFTDQVAVLYVLSTLAMCGLFIVVAFSNLKEDAEMRVAAIREAGDEMSTNSRDLGREGRRAA